MSHHHTEEISGLLDGELKGVRRWVVERHVQACPICAVEYRRQRHVRRMLQANPLTVQMTDSAEFFWSKVKAEIKDGDARQNRRPMIKLIPDWSWQHPFALATGVTITVAALCVFWLGRTTVHPVGPVGTGPSSYANIEQVKTAIPNTAATPLQPDDSQITVIWMSGLPWTPDMNAMKTEFANLNS